MQATEAVRPLSQIANKLNAMHLRDEPNPKRTPTSRLPSTILNRSASRTSNSNAKRASTAPLARQGNLPSLYTHSNYSGHSLSGSRSPLRSSPTHSTLTRPKTPLQIQRRWPPISLLRSRRKLWKRYWLVLNLPTVPESDETVHEIESMQRLRSRSEKLIPRKPPPSEPPSTPVVRLLCRYPPRVTIENLPPPPPELDEDTGSESSSSDDDLDAYEFDLSCCSPPAGTYDKPPVTQRSNTTIRVASHPESDISLIYESITLRTIARIS